MDDADRGLRVGIVGGGLAGMAAAVALARFGYRVTLFEARRQLGGRASSFVTRHDDRPIDLCQHVAMQCCTNLIDFCQRTGVADAFHRVETLHFFDAEGRRCDVRAAPYLPAPLHLGPSILRYAPLAWSDRLRVARGVSRLARSAGDRAETIDVWLQRHGQTGRAIEAFWSVILVSALGETLDRISVAAARKVLVDGFLATRRGYVLLVPSVPLSLLYGERLRSALTALGVALRFGTAVTNIDVRLSRGVGLRMAGGDRCEVDTCVLAVPWRQAARLLPGNTAALDACRQQITAIEGSPITSVHLWFDRPIMQLGHAVLVDRLSQWVFARTGRSPSGGASDPAASERYYYQVVISGSHDLAGIEPSEIVTRVIDELAAVWPAARSAHLLASQVVTEKEAVFSPRPMPSASRPSQRTPIDRLVLAGDWTETGWPSTMESAVRSGYLAAEAVLDAAGTPARVLVDDPPSGLLVRWLVGS